MRVTRLMFASLSILVAVVIFATAGCKQHQFLASKSIKCEKEVLVDPQKQHGVDKPAIYVCEDEPNVIWTAAPGVTFSLDFGGNCPFQTCNISNNQRTGVLNYSSTQPLAVFKYTITINGITKPDYDPHVVGGGG
jgi:hypothetical protein